MSFSDLKNVKIQYQTLPTATRFIFPATWTPSPNTATPSSTHLPPTPTVADNQTDQESYLLISMDRGIHLVNPQRSDTDIYLSGYLDDEFKNATINKFSPDGNNLIISILQGWNPSKRRIYILDLRNFEIYPLLQESAAQTHAEWSPNGERIALTLFYENESKNYIVNIDGSGLQELPGVKKWNMWPKWSPDGKKIYFLTLEEYDSFTLSLADIYEVDANGDNLRKLTSKAYGLRSFNLSPDGSKIAFSAPTMGEDIYVLNLVGGGVANITNSSSREPSFVWAPDSSRIAFQTDRDGNWEMYVIDVDGSNPIRLTNHYELDAPNLWSPSGDYIAFISKRSGEHQIYTYMMDDHSIQQITYSNDYPYLSDIWTNKVNSDYSLLDIIDLFQIGASLKISNEGNNLSLRTLPGTESEILVFLKSGDVVNILDGPHNEDGYSWWKISIVGQNDVGWVAENVDWFEPVGQ
jgi:TolB protein